MQGFRGFKEIAASLSLLRRKCPPTHVDLALTSSFKNQANSSKSLVEACFASCSEQIPMRASLF